MVLARATGRRGAQPACGDSRDCLGPWRRLISRARRSHQGLLSMADFAAARLNMVESQVRPADVTDVRIHDAMRELPRERFVPPAKAYLAYADIEVEYAPGRW